jgi:hypothetical protein
MLQLVELISGNVIFEIQSWTEGYALRDVSQEHALASGKDLTEERYGIRIAANVPIEHAIPCSGDRPAGRMSNTKHNSRGACEFCGKRRVLTDNACRECADILRPNK